MKALNITYLLCYLYCLVSTAQAESEIDVIRDEDYIPFYVSLVRDQNFETASLSVGERAIVLRPLTPDSLRVEVSRKGIFTLPAHATDVASEIEYAKQSADSQNTKLIPRMALFLTNRMISGESGWQNPLPIETVHAFERWFLLYGKAGEESTERAVRRASEFYSSLPEAERNQMAFLYMDTVGDKASIQAMAEMLEPSIQCMPGYLSRGYTRSLDQFDAEQGMPQLIELAASGRIIERLVGLPALEEWLDVQ
jgi:hypothetical protein